MHSFGFKVIPSDNNGSGIPVAVAGQTMVDIQRLLTTIGSMIVRMELRIQNEIPSKLSSKFDLSIGGTSNGGIGSDPKDGSDTLMEDALNTLSSTLDFLGKGVVGSWMEDNFPEPLGRKAVAQGIIDLADHIAGFTLQYGPSDDMREFRSVDREKLRVYADADVSAIGAASIGRISRDQVRKNRWTISNGAGEIQISFGPNIDESDIPSFASAGPVIVTGTVVRNGTAITEVRNVNGCYSFPTVKFHRIITGERDIILLNPAIATPSIDQKGMWHLSSDIIGIDVSKPSWDECVTSYHEYFAFLWETYCESDEQYEGEELEIQEYLRSLAPVI